MKHAPDRTAYLSTGERPMTRSTLHSHDHKEPPVIGPVNVIRGIHGLWAARVISQDTLFLGAQVCQRMIASNTTQTTCTGTLAQTGFTVLQGTIYTGPITKTLSTYVVALQELHLHAGLLSSLIPTDRAERTRVVKRPHFTMDPTLHPGEDYDFNTLVCFKVQDVAREDYFAQINSLAAAHLADCFAYPIEE